MPTVYGDWIQEFYRTKLDVSYSNSTSTQVTINISVSVEIHEWHHDGGWNFWGRSATSTTWNDWVNDPNWPYLTGPTTMFITSASRTVTRTHSSQSIKVWGETMNDYVSGARGPSTASYVVTVDPKPSYSITYNANNGTGAPVGTTKWYNEDLTLSTTKPTRTGYSFLGWSTSSTATSATYAAGGKYTANAAAALYAVWKADTYTVSYVANGGTGTTTAQTKTYNVALTLRSALSRANSSTKYTVTLNANGGSSTGDSDNKLESNKTVTYTWAGWKSSADNKVYAAGSNYTLNKATTMTAQWTSSESGGSVTLPTPTRPSYTFSGWYTASSGGSKAGNAGATYTPSGNVTLWAHWYQSSWTVSYNGNASSGVTNIPSSQTKTQGSTLTLSSTRPSRTGYTFLGWNTSSTATTATYQPGGSYTADAAAVLYAIWRENTFAITYNANGGTRAPAATTKRYTQDAKITTGEPTRSGCTFLGWCTTADGSGTKYKANDTYSTNANITLYAMWVGVSSALVVTRTDLEDDVVKPNDMGTGGLFTLNWEVTSTVPTETSASFVYQRAGETEWHSVTSRGDIKDSSAKSGAAYGEVAVGTLEQDEAYYVRSTVTTTQSFNDTVEARTHVRTVTLGKAFALFDAKAGGTGLAIGTVATTDNLLEVAFASLFHKSQTLVTNTETEGAYLNVGTLGNTKVRFGVGEGGVNHGVWSDVLSKWLIHANETATVVGNAITIGTDKVEHALRSLFRKSLDLVQTVITRDVDVTSPADGDVSLNFRDSLNNLLAYVDAHKNPDGTNYLRLTAYGKNGTPTANVYLGSDGTRKRIGTDAKWATNLHVESNGIGYWCVDNTGTEYPAITDNGTNIWIGAASSGARQHVGGTYISAGHNGTAGNQTIYVAVPNAGNTGATGYPVYHGGYKPTPAGIGALPTAGGTMTGTLTMHGAAIVLKDDRLNRDGSVSSDVWSMVNEFRDADGERFGGMQVFQLKDGRDGVRIQAFSDNSSGTQVLNAFEVMVDKSGNQTYWVSSPANFRSAIGAAAGSEYYASLSKTNCSGGSIVLYVRGKVGIVILSGVKINSISSRSTFATIPSGYRPAGQRYGYINGHYSEYLIVNDNGTVQGDSGLSGQTIWGQAMFEIV